MNNNEPVAWMQMTNKQCVTKISFVQTWADDVPLYTHPVKELTDDEILELWSQKNNLNGAQDILDFARAILRKAKE